MITLHLITQDDQPYGSVRRCCEACGLMKTPDMMHTDARGAFERARRISRIIAIDGNLEEIVVVACDRTPLAFKKWNDRPWHIQGDWGHDPGDEDRS